MTARRHVPPFCAAGVGGSGVEFDELLQFGPTQATRASVRNEERSATWSYGDGGLLEGGLNRGSFVNGTQVQAQAQAQAPQSNQANKAAGWSEPTRVAAPATQDLAQSQMPPRTSHAETVVAAPQLGWGDREETSTQLWSGLPHQRFSLKTQERAPTAGSATPRPGRLPVEARPRLPSPSVAPGRANAAHASHAAHEAPVAPPPRTSEPPQTMPAASFTNGPRPLPFLPTPPTLSRPPNAAPSAPSAPSAPTPPAAPPASSPASMRGMPMMQTLPGWSAVGVRPESAVPAARPTSNAQALPVAPAGAKVPPNPKAPSPVPTAAHVPQLSATRTQPMPPMSPMSARVSMVPPKPWTPVPVIAGPNADIESPTPVVDTAVVNTALVANVVPVANAAPIVAAAPAVSVATPLPRAMPPRPPARKSEPPVVAAPVPVKSEPDPREAAFEQLQDQLVETMERARTHEAHAREAEERAARAEAQLSATTSGAHPEVDDLRVKLATATQRFEQSELQLVEAERRAQSSEELVRLAKQRLADASAQADDYAAPQPKSYGLGVLLGGVGFCLLTTGLGGYFGAVSPLQKQIAAQHQQQQLDNEQHARALATLQSQRDGERRSFETDAQELRTKLQAALTESLNAADADIGRGGRSARAARRAATEQPIEGADESATRSARAIAHRYRRARAAEAQADGDSSAGDRGDQTENSRPSRPSRAEARTSEDSNARAPRAQHAGDDNDPLGGL